MEVKSPGMMMGYYKNEEATREAITEDGWLKTGDRGEIACQGRLKLTGRTKELFKTSKGKYVAPTPIENKLNMNNHVELSCVSGSGQPQPFAMVQLSEESKKAALDAKNRQQIGVDLLAYARDVVNKSVDPHEALQRIVVVKEDWLPENGFLTPTTLKLKRGFIEGEDEEEVDGWYAQKTVIVWAGW